MSNAHAPSTPATILRAAADYIERHGYHRARAPRDNFGAELVDPPASDVGAITLAIYGQRLSLPEPAPTAQFRLYRAAINAYVDLFDDDIGGESFVGDEVVRDLRAAADIWDARNSGGAQ